MASGIKFNTRRIFKISIFILKKKGGAAMGNKTKDYKPNTRMTRNSQKKKDRAKQIVMALILVLLLAMLGIAIFFIGSELIKRGAFNSTVTTEGTEATVEVPGTSDPDVSGEASGDVTENTGSTDTGTGPDIGDSTGSIIAPPVTPDDSGSLPGVIYINRSFSNEKIYEGDLILINANCPYRATAYKADEIPSNMLEIRSSVFYKKVMGADGKERYAFFPAWKSYLENKTLEKLMEMVGQFYIDTSTETSAGNQDLYISAWNGYRSYKDQEAISSSASNIKTYEAAPGQSEHHTGLAFDVTAWLTIGGKEVFASLDETQYQSCNTISSWLLKNAYKYGFIRRYAPDKLSYTGVVDNWQFRYVGYPHAYYMSQNNLCLEEYLGMLEAKYVYGTQHLEITADDGTSYEIYYVPANIAGTTTSIPVPATGEYTVSGNNSNGFIVTITK